MLQTRNLSYQYPEQKKIVYPDINCNDGDELLILGESGSGKTTLLHLLAGILPVQTGKVVINTQELSQLSAQKMDHFRGQNIGIIFQDAHFIKSLTIRENISLAQKLAEKPLDNFAIDAVLSSLNIEDKADRYVYQLSRGEKQRAAIARAIINKPSIILADEPSSALDDHNCEEVITLLKKTANAVNASLIIVTHDVRLITKVDAKVILASKHLVDL